MKRTANARIAGFTFLAYIAIGIAHMAVFRRATAGIDAAARLESARNHAAALQMAPLLTLAMAAAALILAVTLHALTRDEDADLATLSMSFRIGEGIVAVMPITAMGTAWLAGNPDAAGVSPLAGLLFSAGAWQTTVAATLFAAGSLGFSWLMLRGRLIPRPLGWLGVAASAQLLVMLPLELIDVVNGALAQAMWLPMAAFEIPLGIWLLVTGAVGRDAGSRPRAVVGNRAVEA